MNRPSATRRFVIVTRHQVHWRSGRSDEIGEEVSIQAFSSSPTVVVKSWDMTRLGEVANAKCDEMATATAKDKAKTLDPRSGRG